MTTGNMTTMTLSEFEHLLDGYGADRTRWPLKQRSAASALLAASPDARRLLAESEALDRVLAQAPGAKPRDLDALAARIVATASVTPRLAHATSIPSQGTIRPSARQDVWRAAALLAASLLIGVFVGVSNPSGSVTNVLEGLSEGGPAIVGATDTSDEDYL
jgi:hypothetical protein